MTHNRLAGKRVLVTSAETFMGPAIVDMFTSEGASVIADASPLTAEADADELIERSGHIDVLVANFDVPADRAKVADIDDAAWALAFDAMVHPLMRIVRAAAPQMTQRQAGSIVAMTSSSPLRRMSPQATTYVTARGAQNTFVRSAGHELAKHNVRLNAIAQNFVANETYYPAEVLENPRFQERLRLDVPAARVGSPEETAELAVFLASDNSSFIYGQIISQDGGWS
jgi:2-keto-3-deoxy-L-fuconate dehydrogenase